MIYGSITYATLTGGGSGGNAYQVRFGYQILSENVANNTRQVKLQLEVRSVKSAYGTYGFNQTSTIDGTTLSSAVFDMRSTNTWQIFGSRTITITGAYNGTKSGSFTTDATTSSGNYTLKSGSASVTLSLPTLHQAPIPHDITFTEQNSTLSNLGVAGNYFVPYLSIKKAKIEATTYDGATVTLYKLINGSNVYSSQTDEVTMNFQQNELYTIYMDYLNRNIVNLYVNMTDDMGATSQYAWPSTYIIPYTKPNLERTSTNIKRKSGNGTNLTDNKASLNLVGTIYKENDAVGNNNSVTQIGYKIWEDGTSEPASYTTLTPTISGGNVTVTDLEISNINFTKIYNYKIILADNYGYNYVIEDTVPLGQATWTEYKDRVDFLKLTVKGLEVKGKATIYDGALEGGDYTTLSNVKRFLDIYVRINFANRDGIIKYTIDTSLDNPVYGGAYLTPFDENNMGTMYVSEASYNNGTLTHTRIGYVALSTGTFTSRNGSNGYIIYRIDTYD